MLILPIKKKWFDMILLGEKKEEYREIKPYYTSRFKKYFKNFPVYYPSIINPSSITFIPQCIYIIFRNGYRKDSLQIKCRCQIEMGEGKSEWRCRT